jgi:hypothetical protein
MGLLDNLPGAKPVPEIKSDTTHYEALGRVITSFANAEAAVHVLARKLSGLPDAKARIIFGGMRLVDLTDIVKQMARIDAVSSEQYLEIEKCLTQLNYIGAKRHILVHRSSNFFDGKLFVTNILTSKVITSSETEVIEIELLANMQLDCMRIYLRLDYVSDLKKSSPEWAELIPTMKLQPWRYKHIPPKTPNLKPRDKSSKSSDEPRVSRASRRREAIKRIKKL